MGEVERGEKIAKHMGGLPAANERDDPYRVELRRFREQLSAYYEKLALLDGGTVALVVTAVLGPFQDKIRHRHFLVAGLTILVIAVLILLYRNLLAVEYERASTAAWYATARSGNNDIEQLNRLLIRRQRLEVIGVIATGLGILILLVNVWLIFW